MIDKWPYFYQNSNENLGIDEDSKDTFPLHIDAHIEALQTEGVMSQWKRAGYERTFNTIQR